MSTPDATEPSDTGPGDRPPTRWWSSGAARGLLLFMALAGFAVLVVVYMQVVNRSVDFCVRVYAAGSGHPGETAAVQATLYRPESARPLGGNAQLSCSGPDGQPLTPVTGYLRSDTLTTFQLGLGEVRRAGSVQCRLDVQPTGTAVTRSAHFSVDVAQPQRPWLAWGDTGRGLLAGSADLVERPHSRRYRTDPSDAAVQVDVVAEGGAPVRLVENRFYLRVTDTTGHPLSGRRVRVYLADDETRTLETDAAGLAEFRAELLDLVLWRAVVSTDRPGPDAAGGDSITAHIEVVPSWDGLVAHVEPPVVEADAGVGFSVESALSADQWYYDLLTDGAWLDSDSQSSQTGRWRAIPREGSWAPPPSTVRLATLQVYAQPFSGNPQRAVRAIVMRPAAMSDARAVGLFAAALARRGVEGDYIAALQRQGLFDEGTSQETLWRLTQFLGARLTPAYHPRPVVYDDRQAQEEALRSEVSAFRRRSHWLLGLGLLGLMAWLVGQVGVSMWLNRRRAARVLAEIESAGPLDLDPTGGRINESRGALLMLLFAMVTISGFFVGVIALLAAM